MHGGEPDDGEQQCGNMKSNDEDERESDRSLNHHHGRLGAREQCRTHERRMDDVGRGCERLV